MYAWQISELLFKYPPSCGQPNYEFLQHFLLCVGPIDNVDREQLCAASIATVWFGLSSKVVAGVKDV